MTVLGAGKDDLATGSTSVALGDFNDDGEPDALIGAPAADGPDGSRVDAGEAYVVFGPLEGERDAGKGQADITIFGALPGDGLGFTVLAGDLNDDGKDDVLVGAPGVTAGFDPRSDQGRVYVFYGGKDIEKKSQLDLASDVYDFTVTGAEGFSRLGDAIALGDVNGDEKTDLVVGAPFAGRAVGSPPGSARTTLGEVYVVFGGVDLFGELNIAATAPDVLLSGGEAFGQFASAVAVADVNGDGVDDIAVGAHRSSGQTAQGGAVYVFFGRDGIGGRITVENGEQDATILAPAASASFGFPLVSGDFNGDGTADLAAGARTEGHGDTLTAGAVRIIFGGKDIDGERDLSSEAADVTIPGPDAGLLMPSALAVADVDGDRASDLVIGSMLAAGPESRLGAGAVYVMRGGGALPPEIKLPDASASTVFGAAADDRLGNALAAGKASGDSMGLLIVAPGVDPDSERVDYGAIYAVTLETP